MQVLFCKLPSLLSIERRPPPPTQTRREWRYDNTGDVKIAPWFIASFLFIRQLWCCTTYQGFLSTRDTGLRDGNPPPSAEPRQCEWTVGFLDRRGDLHEKSATLPPRPSLLFLSNAFDIGKDGQMHNPSIHSTSLRPPGHR